MYLYKHGVIVVRDPTELMNVCSLDWSHSGVTGIHTWCAQDRAYESRYISLHNLIIIKISFTVCPAWCQGIQIITCFVRLFQKGGLCVVYCLYLKVNLHAKAMFHLYVHCSYKSNSFSSEKVSQEDVFWNLHPVVFMSCVL